MFEIIRYTDERKDEWNTFAKKSKNGTFLLNRNYMDYHRDRFEDCSLMFYRSGTLYAMLPANKEGDTLVSHAGLTYGGLIMSTKTTTANVMTLFAELNEWLLNQGIKTVTYKPKPYIYNIYPSEEDLYALFRMKAALKARGVSSTIDMLGHIHWRQNRRTALNKAKAAGVTVELSYDYATFWKILEDNLMKTHGLRPVHTKNEMWGLKGDFQKEIQLYAAMNSRGKMIAGILLYITGPVIHSQYIAANDEGKKNGAIDAIMAKVLTLDALYFDFGISTENGGQYLNEKLIFQKEGFGARALCYDTYEWDVEKALINLRQQ